VALRLPDRGGHQATRCTNLKILPQRLGHLDTHPSTLAEKLLIRRTTEGWPYERT
jgi:hypothetical protein